MNQSPLEIPFEMLRPYILCGYCNIRTQKLLKTLYFNCEHEDPPLHDTYMEHNISIHKCTNCLQETIYLGDKKIFPLAADDVEPPNADLPDNIKADYIEAAQIIEISPRGAGALLRLCVEKLCNHLIGKPTKIDSAIEILSQQGLPVMIQESLDIVRVIGNSAVHAGTLDVDDDIDTVKALFGLVNQVANLMITQPKNTKAFYKTLPEHKRVGIENRKKRFEGNQKKS